MILVNVVDEDSAEEYALKLKEHFPHKFNGDVCIVSFGVEWHIFNTPQDMVRCAVALGINKRQTKLEFKLV